MRMFRLLGKCMIFCLLMLSFGRNVTLPSTRGNFFWTIAFNSSILLYAVRRPKAITITDCVMTAQSPALRFSCLSEECIVTHIFLLSCVRSGLSVTKSYLH